LLRISGEGVEQCDQSEDDSTFRNYPEMYKYNELNTAFATELYNSIERSNVNYWIFGHSH